MRITSICVFLLAAAAVRADIHQQLLDEAGRQQEARRARFAAVQTKADLESLQQSLRDKFMPILDGLPGERNPPPVKLVGVIEADGYVIEKLVYESLPGYFVPALLYKPTKIVGKLPAVISPCGHSAVGKSATTYQIAHVNLVKRGILVLTYDPVGQSERSQFWDAARGKSRFNLVCGEHAVLGNPLYLLGSSLARYRIWDGIRAIDYLASLPMVDAERIGCIGNSGGGTLTAYISALDPRVKAAAICCYITTLPRRMGNRIEADPDADPEQDIFRFVSDGIDHAGLLALRASRPTLVGAARFDFFPIEGARESFAEAKKLYTVAGVPDRIEFVEAAEKHGLTLPLRQGVYAFFERWLNGRSQGDAVELPVQARPPEELLVCPDGQVNVTYRSRHLLSLALEEFAARKKSPRKSLRELLRPDPQHVDYRITEISPGGRANETLVICLNGNESSPWQEEQEFLQSLKKSGHAVIILDPRGVGKLRAAKAVKGHDYADPLVGVEENLAYNAFLVGKTLLGMRVADVAAAVKKAIAEKKTSRVVLCGRRDAALVAIMTAALEPTISHVAVDEMLPSYRLTFKEIGYPINAASILPNVLRDYGDIGDVLKEVGPHRVLNEPFRKDAQKLLGWLNEP